MVRLCMGGGHFDNRADEERLQGKAGNISTKRSSLQSKAQLPGN